MELELGLPDVACGLQETSSEHRPLSVPAVARLAYGASMDNAIRPLERRVLATTPLRSQNQMFDGPRTGRSERRQSGAKVAAKRRGIVGPGGATA